jgi:hypothetical protein
MSDIFCANGNIGGINMTKKHPHKTYVLTWRDPNQANRNVYVTIDKRYKYCPTCQEPVDLHTNKPISTKKLEEMAKDDN